MKPRARYRIHPNPCPTDEPAQWYQQPPLPRAPVGPLMRELALAVAVVVGALLVAAWQVGQLRACVEPVPDVRPAARSQR